MKVASVKFAVLIVLSAASSNLNAQDYRPGTPISSPPLVQHHASTAAEGWLRGRADLTRAMGEYNYNTSLAWINAEEARSRNFDNRVKYAETYFAKRRINREARAAERSPRASQADLARFSKEKAPARLASSQFDPVLGAINWPTALDGDEFASCRERIEQLFEERSADDSGLGSQNYRLVQKVAGEMRSMLKDKIGTLDSSSYVAAKKFINSVAHEARFTTDMGDIEGIASR